MQANPASELVLPKKESRLPEQALTLSQIDDVLNAPDVGDALGLRDRAMLELLYATAIRRSELARLEVGDLNREAATLRVRLGKGKNDRVVPVGTRALHWCERYVEEVRPRLEIVSGEQTLFLTRYGEGFHPNALGYLIAKHLCKAGIEKGGSHLLRHAPARRRSGHPLHPEAARPRQPGHHRHLYGDERGSLATRLQRLPPRRNPLERERALSYTPAMTITHQTVLGPNGEPTAAIIPWEEFERIQAQLGDASEVSAEWQEEIERRAKEIDKGEVKLVDGRDFLDRLNAV